MLVAILECEIGFWVLLAIGLAARYLLRLRRTSTVLLIAVPVVDVALLVFTVVDLRRGTAPDVTHALAAVYLGFSVAFGHALVTWADRTVAHRFAGGPPPPPKPRSGTAARVRKEWREWGLAALGYAITCALIGLMVVLVGETGADTAPLLAPVPGLGTALVIWLLCFPVVESVRARGRR